jgi:hypothetical protein
MSEAIIDYPLQAMIETNTVSLEVVRLLLPSGLPLDRETQLFDYKRCFPELPPSPNDEDRLAFDLAIAEMIKDSAAMFNAFGGYILSGVEDSGDNRIIGCDVELDNGDFNKRLEGAVGQSIETQFQRFPWWREDGTICNLGLLFVPRRSGAQKPAAFRKAAPANPRGKKAFNKDEVFVRIRDESRLAQSRFDDWSFLLSNRSPNIDSRPIPGARLKHNLPGRDPNLVSFIGRETDLAKLRGWMLDRFQPLRLLTGTGGLGKTTVAYRFCEEVLKACPIGIEYVVWLTAKEQHYSAVQGQLINSTRVDFTDLNSLLRCILRTLGSYEPSFDEASADDLQEAVIDALTYYSALIVVDDVDTLTTELQREVVACLNAIALRSLERSSSPTRILMTSRIDLGLAPAQVVRIQGLPTNDFREYVRTIENALGINLSPEPNWEQFSTKTSGSPLFAASVLRLVKLDASNVHDALEQWQGHDGEDVRRFAFLRELDQLKLQETKVLYIVCTFGQVSFEELAELLEVGSTTLRSWIASLRAYHLLSTSEGKSKEQRFFVPDDIALMRDLVRNKLGGDATKLDAACARLRARGDATESALSAAKRRISSLWMAREYNLALAEAEEATQKYANIGEAWCLLGKAFLLARPPYYRRADQAFLKASDLKYNGTDLAPGWIRCREELGDWQGVWSICEQELRSARFLSGIEKSCIKATETLLSIAYERRDLKRCSELLLFAVRFVDAFLSRNRLPQTEFDNLRFWSFDKAREYVSISMSRYKRPGDHIEVFSAVMALAELGIVLADMVRTAVDYLETWWDSVEKRPLIDRAAIEILNKSLVRVGRLESYLLSASTPKHEVISQIQAKRRYLGIRGAQVADSVL